jgi:hypothetical protein
MPTLDIQVAKAEDDADCNSSTGDAVYRDCIIVGDWYWWVTMDGYIRFWLPIHRNTTIDVAYLSLYVKSKEKTPTFTAYIYHSDEVDAQPLTYGCSRAMTATNVSWSLADETLGWINTPSIATLIQETVNQSTWEYGNHIIFKIDKGNADNELYRFESYDSDASRAPKLHIEYTILEESLSDTIPISDSSSPILTPPDSTKIYLDTIELHTEDLDHDLTCSVENEERIETFYQSFTLHERMDVVSANVLMDYVGKNVPLWVKGTSYNCLVESVDMSLDGNWIYADVTISLVNTRK